jgi:hypothetical protein
MQSSRCPRCREEVAAPTVLDPTFRCTRHGAVHALGPAVPFDQASVADLAARSDVPVWLPDPLPAGWLLTGLRSAHTARRRAAAAVVGLSGHGLDAGPTDVLLVAEEPGCGLGSSYAGLDHGRPDPGPVAFEGPPAARVSVRVGATEHTAGLWSVVPGPVEPDRSVFLGEAAGAWLWVVGWPATAWALLEDGLRLADARTDRPVREQPAGALNPRLQ